MDKTRFYGKFKEIAKDRLQKLNALFLDLEKDTADGERLKNISREIHSLKGEAKMVGFEKTTLLLHRLEDLMSSIKEGTVLFKDEVSDLIFKTLDSVDKLVDLAIEGRENEFELNEIFSDIDGIIKGDFRQKEETPIRSETISSEGKKTPAVPSFKMHDTIRIDLKKLDILGDLVGQIVINQIKQEEVLNHHRILLGQLRMQNKLWAKIKEEVDEHKDKLEMVMSDSFLEYFGKYDKGTDRFKEEFLDMFTKEKAAFFNLEMVTSMLKEDILSLRLYPLADIFALFRRNVRDIARQQKKKVKFEISGENTEIDLQIFEKLSEALLHLIRNAISHGIEPSDVRIKRGKPEEGSLSINAYHIGESVCIEVCDDGQGIDPEYVKELAIKKKIISREEAETLSEEESLYLIFRSGFSTSSMITDISGRGVGLDVVKVNIEELKGEFLLKSEVGRGTNFLLKFPLTLALLKCLLVEVGGESYAIPSQDIDRCVEIKKDEIDLTGQRSAFVHNNRIIPLISLGPLLGVDEHGKKLNDRVRVVIITHLGQYLGLIIDRFIIEQEMVVKSLGRQLGKIRNISCVTTLGSGELVPVLHISDMFDSARKRRPEFKKEIIEIEGAENGRGKILVVEDSLITREMEKNVLEAAGFEVETAEDGLEGLLKAEKELYDLIITDVEMPRLDGFQLTKKIKEDENLSKIPVIILTTRASEEDKKNGLKVGADAYITKSAFDQGSLLETIERLI